MKFEFIHTCIDSGGVCSVYYGYTSINAFVAFYVSITGFMLYIPHIYPLKWDCHQLPKWGRLKVHGAPCVVLVIDDNLYGLMFALSYT